LKIGERQADGFGNAQLTSTHREGTCWLNQVRERVERVDTGSPSYLTGRWRELLISPSFKYFSGAEEVTMPYSIPATLDSIVNSYRTASSFVRLSSAERQDVIDDLKGIVERGEGKEWIDKEKGTFQYCHTTELVISKRL
jgi:hypothetical protein